MSTPPSARRSVTAAAAAVLLAVAAVVYNNWLLQFFVRTGLDQVNSYVSEAFAADQPHRWLFGGIEMAAAGLVIAAAVLGGSIAARFGLVLTGWVAISAFGACTVADVLLPMECAPSLEPGCPSGNLSHTITSGLVHFALFASMAAFIVAARRAGATGRVLPLVRRWGVWLFAVSMVSALGSVGPHLGYPGGQGVAQRVHLVAVGLWFALLAVELLRGGFGDVESPGAATNSGVPILVTAPAN